MFLLLSGKMPPSLGGELCTLALCSKVGTSTMLQASVSWGPWDSLSRANPSFLCLAKRDEAQVEVREGPGGATSIGLLQKGAEDHILGPVTSPSCTGAGMELGGVRGGKWTPQPFIGAWPQNSYWMS